VQLTDFIIKKVIDKGSFGKVFLVQHNKTGKLYAMKRLNKDVILQKNQKLQVCKRSCRKFKNCQI
jgi:serine/threonine protein kinase